MCDHPQLRYSNHSQQGILEALNQEFHDINPTSKHAFLDF